VNTNTFTSLATAVAAFLHANTAYAAGNTTWTYAANDVMRTANSAYAQANVANNTANSTCIGFVIDGGGAPITAGEKGSIEVPFACDIVRWTMLTDISGSANIDMWSRDYSTTMPTAANSMTGNLGMTLSTARANQSTAMGNWRMTRINAGNVISYNVQSASTITKATITLYCNKLGH
jgi:hypothetical protein